MESRHLTILESVEDPMRGANEEVGRNPVVGAAIECFWRSLKEQFLWIHTFSLISRTSTMLSKNSVTSTTTSGSSNANTTGLQN